MRFALPVAALLAAAPPPAQAQLVSTTEADEGVAVGGDVTDSVIINNQGDTIVNEGATEDELADIADRLDALQRLIGDQLPPGLSLQQAQAILSDFGIEEIAENPARIGSLLADKAIELTELQVQLRRLSGDDPQVDRLRTEAADLIEAGELDAARDRLLAARDRDRAAREELEARARTRRYSEAATEGELGDLARARLAYREAAIRYAAAAEVLPEDDVRNRWAWRRRSADALQLLGLEFGDNSALREAIALYRDTVLPLAPRDHVPLDWAMTQNNLGAALQTLGERESGTDRLEQAVEAYRSALLEYTRDRVPLDWATTQNNLGNALRTLGERESGPDRLEQAVEAYRSALLEYTRDRVPLDWAMTQSNLGNALRNLGERERGTDRLDQAVEAYRSALLEYTRDRVPLDWAMTQNNLGNALQTLGERESGTDRLEQAVEAFRSALLELTRDRVPLNWAGTQNNLGTALQTLGARESGTDRLEQAVEAYRSALLELTRDRVPLDWAQTQNNLGGALWTLGARESGTDRLEQAVEAYRSALLERTRARVPLDWAQTTENLGLAEAALFDKTGEPERLDQAERHVLAAREVYDAAGAGFYIERSDRILAWIRAKRP